MKNAQFQILRGLATHPAHEARRIWFFRSNGRVGAMARQVTLQEGETRRPCLPPASGLQADVAEEMRGSGRGVGEGTEMGSRGVSIMARARPKMKGAAPSKEGRTKTWWPLGQVRPHGHGRLPRSPPPVRSHPGFGDRLEHHRPLTPGLRPLGQRQRLPGPPLPPRRPGSRPFPRRAEPRCSSAPGPALFPAAPASLLPIARLSASTAATPERPRLAPLTSSQQPLPR